MTVEGKANAKQEEQNLERPVSPEGMLKSFAMTHAFKNRPLRRFQQTLMFNTSRVKAQVDKRFLRSNVLSEALRQFSRRTFGKRRTMSLAQGGASKEKGRKWSALAMTLPSGTSGDQGIQPTSTSLSSRTFSSGSSIPAFSLPDQGSVFSQVSSAVEQTVSKPKWKPPEPGARRFSRVEEVHTSQDTEAPLALGTASDASTTLQKSPKPGPQATLPIQRSARIAADPKPVEPAARPTVAATPTNRKSDRQTPTTEILTPQSGSSQQRPIPVLEPALQKGQRPSAQIETSSPAKQVLGSQTPPAPEERQVSLESRAETQTPAPERSQIATQTSSESLPKSQSPAASNVLPQAHIQEPVPPVQMPLASRRSLPGGGKIRQNLIGQHRYHLSRPQSVLPKATQVPAIQRKTFQLPLKRRMYPQMPPVSTAVSELTPPSLPVSQSLIHPVTPVQVPEKVQPLPIPALKIPSAAPTTLEATAKNVPLQRKSLYLPLKRPVLAARKPSAVQTRRLNIAAMPLRQSLAKVAAAKAGIETKAGLPPTEVKTSPAKPTRSSQATTPGATLPNRLTTGTPQALAPKAVLAQEPSSEIAQAPAAETNLLHGQASESAKPAEAPALPILALPLISKTLLQRISGRRQLLQARPITRWQREPASLPSARPGISRVSRLPGQSIQRSLHKSYLLIPTRSVQRQEPEFVEGLSNNAAKIPSLSSQPTRFEATQAPEKSVPIARATAVKPAPPAEPQTGSQAQVQAPQQAAQPVLQPRRKADTTQAGSTQALPTGASRSTVPSLSALRRGKPVLASHAARKASVETGQMKAGPLPKPEGKPAITSPVSRQLLTPIRAIKSTPVVQRKPQQEDEGWMYQSESQNLPLASQPPAPPMGPASQSQSSFASSSGRNAHQQQSMPPAPPLPPSSSNLFAEEERPEMPLRTPIRPNTFESPSQSDQEMPDLSGGMREESLATYTGGAIPPQTDAQNRPNLQELARKVYPEIVRMLNVETEWLGRRL